MTAVQPSSLGRYLTAAVLARLADEGARIALVLLAVDRVGSTAFGGLLAACFLIPHIVAASVTGVLADRSAHRGRFQAATLAGFGGCLVLIGLLAGAIPNLLLVIIALVGGCLAPMVTGGLSSQLRDLVADESRDRAYGLDVMTYNMAGLVGPAGAAVLASVFSPGLATIALGISVTVAGVIAISLPIGRAAAATTTPLTIGELVSTDAFRFTFRNPVLRNATAISSLSMMGTAALPIGAVILAEERGNPSLAGVLIAASAIGGLAGSLIYARWPFGTVRLIPTMLGCIGMIAILVVCVPFVGGSVLAFLLFMLIGAPSGLLGSLGFIVRDQESSPALQTQVFTIGAGIKLSSGAIGTWVAGVIATQGSDLIFMLMAAAQLLAAVVGMVLLSARRADTAYPNVA